MKTIHTPIFVSPKPRNYGFAIRTRYDEEKCQKTSPIKHVMQAESANAERPLPGGEQFWSTLTFKHELKANQLWSQHF